MRTRRAPWPISTAYAADFIVLQADELASRLYLRDWFEHSIPDSCARLIRHSEGPVVQQIEIYQWTCSD